MTISRDEVSEVESHKYLEFFVQKNGGSDKDVKHRINQENRAENECSGDEHT